MIGLVVLLLIGGGVTAFLLTRTKSKEIPAVAGQQVSTAQTLVQNAGFNPVLIYRTDKHKSGTVIAQNPLGGTTAKEGSTVTLTVSQGPGSTTIPSVSFLSEAKAKQAIKQARLKVSRVQPENSNQIPVGDATRTDPVAGTLLPVGGERDPVRVIRQTERQRPGRHRPVAGLGLERALERRLQCRDEQPDLDDRDARATSSARARAAARASLPERR